MEPLARVVRKSSGLNTDAGPIAGLFAWSLSRPPADAAQFGTSGECWPTAGRNPENHEAGSDEPGIKFCSPDWPWLDIAGPRYDTRLSS
jgi:hypothetical protein